MSIRAAFIGVDRYRDPQVRDLEGARRDALALWALFSDTVEDIDAECVTDGNATLPRVRQLLGLILGGASDDEIVIVSLSCHGTHDHRIALHDVELSHLTDTTLAMEDLAILFRASKAKAILIILDCCFSGGAPARVIEQSPVTRAFGSPFETIAGAGRILIAASGVDEPALELPGTGHGLLTGAILEALQNGDGPISLTTAIDGVMQRVRAEAARMSYVQTPVMLGHVEGGLTLPRLQRGENYYKHFPELRPHRATGPMEKLSAFGLSAAMIDAWKRQFSDNLNSLQLAAVNQYGVLDGNSLLVVAPTSSGKTFIGELAAARALTVQRKAVFLFPYKALVNEKFDQFTRVYRDTLEFRVIRCTGDYQDATASFHKGKYDLALLTYETFLNLVITNPAALHQIGLVVIDEAQFIADPKRGITVELLITYLLSARTRGITPQLIALSAVIGDLNHFDEWLSCSRLVTDHRPVPLIEGVIDRSGVYQFAEDGNEQTVQLIPRHEIVQRRNEPSAQDVIVPLIWNLLNENPNERVIVFRNKRGAAQGCGKYLAKDLGLGPATTVLQGLPNHDLSTSSAALRDCLRGGTAFHNSNLTRDERLIVEAGFRQRNGEIKALAATTTVAAGINTPASTVILAEQEFLGEDGRAFTVAEYKNMAGRAGRLGYNEKGRCIIYAETATQRIQLFNRYVKGQPEAMRSSFHSDEIETWLLKLLAQVPRAPRCEIIQLLANTYGGYLANLAHPGWKADTEVRLSALLSEMLRLHLLEEEGGLVRLTLLGQACGRSPLSFRSALRLVSLLREHEHRPLSAEQLMVVCQILPEADDTYTPLMKKGQTESKWPQEVQRQYGSEWARLLQRHADDTWVYYARCKRTAVLWSWIRGVPMEDIERRYSANPYQGTIASGHVRQFAEAARFYLGSSFQIATVLLMTNAPPEEQIQQLLQRLELGVPQQALPLLAIPVAFQRGELLDLITANILTPEQFLAVSDAELRSILSPQSLEALSKYRTKVADPV